MYTLYAAYMKRFFITVPSNKLKFTFTKSSGPGGQNVNKCKKKEWDMKSVNTHVNSTFNYS